MSAPRTAPAHSNTSANTNQASSRPLRWVGLALLGLILLLIYVAMSRPADELPTAYGKRRGLRATDSVNGTAVLAGMFESQGHRVGSVTELSRRLEKYSTIVWAPDSFTGPSPEARKFLEQWLANGSGRTLVYIGRDYDAAPKYWQQMLQQVDDPRYDEYQRRLAHAESEFAARRAAAPEHEASGWFTLESEHPRRKIPDLDGPWAENVDASQSEIVLGVRLDIPEDSETPSNVTTPVFPWTPAPTVQPQPPWAQQYPSPSTTDIEILLQSENDILVHRYKQRFWNGSQVIVVANGSFTLNMPLVNKEHRKVAGRLISECGPAGDVVFLESGPSGVTVNEGNPVKARSHALQLFSEWPVNFIFIHFAVLGILFCIAVFPIFGRPHVLPNEARADFGKHVAAFGELLQKTKDTFFAESRIQAYQAQSKRHSGQSHRALVSKPAVPTTESSNPTTSAPPPAAADSTKPTS